MMTEEERKARRRERDRQRYAANPERYRERVRRYREANPERVRESQRRYDDANREQRRAKCRQWHAANPGQSRRWREANPDQAREHARRWREANRERQRERDRRRYAANSERYREYARQWHAVNPGQSRRWREANPDQAREHARRWRKANIERARAQGRLRNHVRRLREINAVDPCQPVTVATTDRRFLLFGNVCCFCGAGGKLTLEHVVALAQGGPHVPSNLAPSCRRCNGSKHDKPVETWYPCQSFFSPDRWEFLQTHTGNRWAAAVQPSLAISLPPPSSAAAPSNTLRRLSPAASVPAAPAAAGPIRDAGEAADQLSLL